MRSGELLRIDEIAARIGRPGPRVRLGIGDDAALVAAPGADLLLCTDAMIENVHFDFKWATPADLGHKALAACLSDIAAMNGEPLYALFSIALPKERATIFLAEFYESAQALAARFGVDIVGGDLSSSLRDVFIDVTAVGQTSAPLTRGGARVGDWLAVSGHPGASAAGLESLRRSGRTGTSTSLLEAHLRPQPRFDLRTSLATARASALIDVSDGVASEAYHLAERSRVGFIIDEAKLPLHPDAVTLAAHQMRRPEAAVEWALHGGEDYELLATFDPSEIQKLGGAPPGFTLIGRAVGADQGLQLRRPDQSLALLARSGFDHFADRG